MTQKEIQELRNNLNELIGKFFAESGLPPTAAALYRKVFYAQVTERGQKKSPNEEGADNSVIARANADYWNFFMAATLDGTPIEVYKILALAPQEIGHGDLILMPGSSQQVYRGVLFTIKTENLPSPGSVRHIIETPVASQMSGAKDLFAPSSRGEFDFVKDSIDRTLADQSKNYIITVPRVSMATLANKSVALTPDPDENHSFPDRGAKGRAKYRVFLSNTKRTKIARKNFHRQHAGGMSGDK